METLEEVDDNEQMQLVQFRGYASNTYFSLGNTPTTRSLWTRTIRNNPAAYIKSNDMEAASNKLKESRNNILLIPEDQIPALQKESGDFACQACFIIRLQCSLRFQSDLRNS